MMNRVTRRPAALVAVGDALWLAALLLAAAVAARVAVTLLWPPLGGGF
jgi:hypothetical protein